MQQKLSSFLPSVGSFTTHIFLLLRIRQMIYKCTPENNYVTRNESRNLLNIFSFLVLHITDFLVFSSSEKKDCRGWLRFLGLKFEFWEICSNLFLGSVGNCNKGSVFRRSWIIGVRSRIRLIAKTASWVL